MTLADLIDLEAQLARDAAVDPGALEARDRALLAGAPDLPRERGALLGRWLSALRDREPAALFPGRAVASTLSVLGAALAAAGLVLGWGAATALLRYTGGHPVNVWDFLLAFVGVQLVLLALLLASALLPVAALGAPLLGMFRSLFAATYPRLAARGLPGGERAGEWRALWHRLRARRSLYQRAEPWVLLGLAQAFGVAFNAGALLAFARLVVFSDIAFSWSTTLAGLDAARFHGLVALLAAPFGWAIPEAVPSLALVEATRYSGLEGAYLASGAGRAARPELVGGWWSFLAAALACYGLLPRLLLLGLARLGRALVLARLPFDDAEVSRLVRRIAEPHVRTGGIGREAPGRPAPGPAAAALHPPPGGVRCGVVLWRDLPAESGVEEAVRRQTGCAETVVFTAGGLDDDGGGRDWARLLDGADRVALVAEGWEAPDRSVLRLLRALRQAAGPRRPLHVLLVGAADAGEPTPGQIGIWRDELARLADPFLAVSPLGGAA